MGGGGHRSKGGAQGFCNGGVAGERVRGRGCIEAQPGHDGGKGGDRTLRGGEGLVEDFDFGIDLEVEVRVAKNFVGAGRGEGMVGESHGGDEYVAAEVQTSWDQ